MRLFPFLLLFLAGCPLVGLLPSQLPSLEVARESKIAFVGRTASTAFVVSTNDSSQMLQVYQVGLDSARAEALSVPVRVQRESDLAVSERWFLWIDRVGQQVLVRDLRQDRDFVLISSSVFDRGFISLVAFRDDLAAFLLQPSPATGSFSLLLANLAESSFVEIDDARFEGGAALSQDRLYFERSQQFSGVARLGVEFVLEIQSLSVAGGEPVTLEQGIRSPSGDNLFFEDGRLYWDRYEDGSFVPEIVRRDIQSGAEQLLTEGLFQPGESAVLLDVHRERLLIEVNNNVGGAPPAAVALVVLDANGQTTTVISAEAGEEPLFEMNGVLLDDGVAFTSPQDGTLMVSGFDGQPRPVAIPD